MNNSEPPHRPRESDRQEIAELLGRILATYWLARVRHTPDLPAAKLNCRDKELIDDSN